MSEIIICMQKYKQLLEVIVYSECLNAFVVSYPYYCTELHPGVTSCSLIHRVRSMLSGRKVILARTPPGATFLVLVNLSIHCIGVEMSNITRVLLIYTVIHYVNHHSCMNTVCVCGRRRGLAITLILLSTLIQSRVQ